MRKKVAKISATENSEPKSRPIFGPKMSMRCRGSTVFTEQSVTCNDDKASIIEKKTIM